MVAFYYVLVALFAIYVGKYEKRVNVGLIAAPVSLPLGIIIGVAAFVIFKWMFIVLAIILTMLSKMKILIKLKIAAILASVAGVVVSAFSGPLGWILGIFLILFIISGIKDVFVSIYHWFFRTLAKILMVIRNIFDSIRKPLPVILHPIVCIVEAAIVCGFALKSLWDLMDWMDGKIKVTPTLIKIRLVILLPYALILYRNYLKDTTSPNSGGEGYDSPLLFEFTTLVDTIF